MDALFANRAWQRLATLCSVVLATLVLASCGGSGAGANGIGATASLKAAALALITSEPSLGSDGRTSATLTAIVKNDLNVSLPGEQVVFSTTDPGANLQVVSNVTDDTGQATAILTISDRSVRTIQVTAASGTIQQTINIPVVGTSVSISGSNTIVFDSPTQFSVSVRDSGGGPVSGVPVTITSSANNDLVPSVVNTDALGQASFQVIGRTQGSDTISASAQGVTESITVTVSGTQLAFVNRCEVGQVSTPLDPCAQTGDPQSPDPDDATTLDLPVNVSHPLRVILIDNGAPVGGATVSFAATRGTLVASSAVTDGNGMATVNISSTSAGISTLTATAPGGTTSTMQIDFVSTTPTKIDIQASPAVVGANLDPGGTRAAQLIAIVRDAADNPVKNQRVDFSSVTDPSNGRIEPGFGITDSFGVATVSFIAGANPTGPDGVTVRAELPGLGILDQTTLTVSEIQLSVVMGTGNTINENTSETAYIMPWVAAVADSSGNPVENAQVTVAVESTQYRKGRWIPDPVGSGWILDMPNMTVCPSEDFNRNGRRDPGEDDHPTFGNNNGILEPGSPSLATVVGDGTTDENGLADITLTYPKSAGAFTEVLLKVTMTTTAGTEGTAEEQFWLPVLGQDVASATVNPPGANAPNGPYGVAADCTNPN